MTPRIATYVRVSTVHQDSAMQKLEIDRYLEARGWTDVQSFEDRGSGTSMVRPALHRLLEDARARRFNVLVVYKMDRLFRSLKDLVATLSELNELGIEFISIRDNIDMTTASGRLLTHLLGAFAEFEAGLIRERVRAGLEVAKKKGVKLGRPRSASYEQILELRKQGLSLSEIGSRLSISKSSVSKSLKQMGLNKPVDLSETIEASTTTVRG